MQILLKAFNDAGELLDVTNIEGLDFDAMSNWFKGLQQTRQATSWCFEVV